MNDHVNPRAVIGGNEPPLAERLAIDEAALLADVQALADRANALPRKLKDETAEADILAIGGVVRDAIALAKRVEARRVEVKAPWLEGGQTVDGFYRTPAQRLTTISTAFQKLIGDWREEKRREEARKAAEEARKRQLEETERRKAAEEAEAKGRQRTAALNREKADEAAKQAEEAQARADAAAAPVATAQVKAEVAPDLTMTAKGEWKGQVVDFRTLDLEVLRPYLKPDRLATALNQAVRMGVRDCRGAEIKMVEKVSFK